MAATTAMKSPLKSALSPNDGEEGGGEGLIGKRFNIFVSSNFMKGEKA
jgi:hypothetical protein